MSLFVLGVDSLPTVDSLQSGLLNDGEHIEDIMSLLNHLLTFALDDPGIPNPKEVMDKLHVCLNLCL